jgi:hypothetical protein
MQHPMPISTNVACRKLVSELGADDGKADERSALKLSLRFEALLWNSLIKRTSSRKR